MSYKYVDVKTILQILQKENQEDMPCGYACLKKILQLMSKQSAFKIPAKKPTVTNQCIVETI